MNQVQTYNPQPSGFQPESSLPASINAGAVSVEQQRAIAEAQGQIAIAKRFPRNLTQAHSELMESCSQAAMAEIAFYSVPRAGGAVSGPSIRLAEEIARCYGNFEYGHKELSRDSDKSEVEVYAWDKEKNNFSRRQITVFHVRDTKNGPMKLRDQKDIDDKIANVASKQVRSRILALLPKWLVQAAENKCRETIAGGGQGQPTLRERVLRMVAAFGKHGVTVKHMERIIGHSMDDITPDEIADLQGIYNALKEGAKIAEFFPEDDGATGAALTQQAIEQHQAQATPETPAPDLTAKPNPTRSRKAKAEPAVTPVPETTPEPEATVTPPAVQEPAITEAEPAPEIAPTPDPIGDLEPDPITQEFNTGPDEGDFF